MEIEKEIVLGSPIDQELAREILGRNFWGAEEWSEFCGEKFSEDQLQKIAKFSWSKKILELPCPFIKDKQIKDTHFAFLGLREIRNEPLPIIRWHQLHSPEGQPRFYYHPPWYQRLPFATMLVCRFDWYLMPLTIPDSSKKTLEEQVALLPSSYRVPFTIEEVTKLILYYKKNGIYLNSNRYARCKDVVPDGSRVMVGFFTPDGLFIEYGDDRSYPEIEIAASLVKREELIEP